MKSPVVTGNRKTSVERVSIPLRRGEKKLMSHLSALKVPLSVTGHRRSPRVEASLFPSLAAAAFRMADTSAALPGFLPGLELLFSISSPAKNLSTKFLGSGGDGEAAATPATVSSSTSAATQMWLISGGLDVQPRKENPG